MNIKANPELKYVEDLSELTVLESVSLTDSMKVLDRNAQQVILVVNSQNKLKGVVTDGDIRRYLIRGGRLNSPIKELTGKDFISVEDTQLESITFSQFRVRHLPVVDKNGILLALLISEQTKKYYNNPVVIMAGGLGTRMRPLTERLPKPMLRIGGQPILEISIRNLVQAGFNNIMIAVNYEKHVIMEHFEDGAKFGCRITYLQEDAQLGTGGALSLIKEELNEPILVMNGDLITSLSFKDVIDDHQSRQNIATMCVRKSVIQIPFGVVEEEDGKLKSIVEKPKLTNLINAGIYVLAPPVLSSLLPGQKVDLPDLLSSLILKGRNVGVFHISEEWNDIGTPSDLIRISEQLGYEFDPEYQSLIGKPKSS